MDNNEENRNDKRKDFMNRINEKYPAIDFSRPNNENAMRHLQIRKQNQVVQSELPGNDR